MTRGCEQWGSVGSTAIPVRVSGNLRPPHLSGRSGSSAESASAGQGTGDQNSEFLQIGGRKLGFVDEPLHSRRPAVGEPQESAEPPEWGGTFESHCPGFTAQQVRLP
jgi:hypothetical protein